MSDDNKAEKNNEFAKNIWLAGLGAYGRAFDEATEKYSKATKDVPKLFNDLVKKGAKLEEKTTDHIAEPIQKASASIEERIERVRHSLGFGPSTEQTDITRLEAKLDKLIDTVDALSTDIKKMQAATAAKKVPVKKSAAKKQN